MKLLYIEIEKAKLFLHKEQKEFLHSCDFVSEQKMELLYIEIEKAKLFLHKEQKEFLHNCDFVSEQ
jgi:hypothetical protein